MQIFPPAPCTRRTGAERAEAIGESALLICPLTLSK
jgi:hypothetical protein